MTNDEKIAALEREVAELKAKVSPPEKPAFVEEPYQRYDPTAGMSMPRSALRAMVAAEPSGFMAGVVADNRNAPTGPTSAIPRSAEQPSDDRGGGSSTPGWVDPTPLGNPPGTNWVDAIAIADDVRQRKERERGG